MKIHTLIETACTEGESMAYTVRPTIEDGTAGKQFNTNCCYVYNNNEISNYFPNGKLVGNMLYSPVRLYIFSDIRLPNSFPSITSIPYNPFLQSKQMYTCTYTNYFFIAYTKNLPFIILEIKSKTITIKILHLLKEAKQE